MGYRIQAAKTYKVEYGDYDCFNYQSKQVEQLLKENAPESFWCSEDGSRMELEREELLAVADKVDNMSEEEFAGYHFDDWCVKEHVSESLRVLANQSDPNDSVVHLFWF